MPNIEQQLDVGVTTLKTLPGLRSLIRIASEDNVQGQAVLALESLGTRVPVSQALIDRATITLNSNDNIKWKDLRLLIGLSQGGTATLLRSSTSGVKAFVLLSALKLSYCDTEISDILHHVMIKSGIQRDVPVPSAQLNSVIEVLGGYARQLVSSVEDRFLFVSNQIIQHCGAATTLPSRLTERLSSHITGDIIARVFDGLTNAEVHQITLEGMVSGVWLATLWTWMIPEWVSVTLNDEVIIGPATAKLHIHLQASKEAENQWRYCEWREEEKMFDSIVTFARHDIVSKFETKFIPWRSTRCILEMQFGWPGEATIAIGQLGNAILKLIIEQGTISRGEAATRTRLEDIASTYCIAHYENFMTHFGWTSKELEPYLTLFTRLEKSRPSISSPRNASGEFDKWLRNAVREEYPTLKLGGLDVSDLVDFALLIATSAMVVSCFQPEDETTSDSSIGKYCLTIDMAGYRKHSTALRMLLLEEGMGVAVFRNMIFETMLSISGNNLKGDELILHQDGIVVYPTILFVPSCQKTHALAFNIKYGTIKYERFRYKVVRDVKAMDFRPGAHSTVENESLRAYEGGEYLCLRPRTQWPKQFIDFVMVSSAQGESVMIKTTLRFALIKIESQTTLLKTQTLATPAEADIEEKEFSWIMAMNSLACAISFSPNLVGQPTPRAEEKLARRLHEAGTLAEMVWLCPSSTKRTLHPYLDIPALESERRTRIIACTDGNTMLQLFQLSHYNSQLMFVSNGLNIVKSIALAEEMAAKRDWMIIT